MTPELLYFQHCSAAVAEGTRVCKPWRNYPVIRDDDGLESRIRARKLAANTNCIRVEVSHVKHFILIFIMHHENAKVAAMFYSELFVTKYMISVVNNPPEIITRSVIEFGANRYPVGAIGHRQCVTSSDRNDLCCHGHCGSAIAIVSDYDHDFISVWRYLAVAAVWGRGFIGGLKPTDVWRWRSGQGDGRREQISCNSGDLVARNQSKPYFILKFDQRKKT